MCTHTPKLSIIICHLFIVYSCGVHSNSCFREPLDASEILSNGRQIATAINLSLQSTAIGEHNILAFMREHQGHSQISVLVERNCHISGQNFKTLNGGKINCLIINRASSILSPSQSVSGLLKPETHRLMGSISEFRSFCLLEELVL